MDGAACFLFDTGEIDRSVCDEGATGVDAHDQENGLVGVRPENDQNIILIGYMVSGIELTLRIAVDNKIDLIGKAIAFLPFGKDVSRNGE